MSATASAHNQVSTNLIIKYFLLLLPIYGSSTIYKWGLLKKTSVNWIWLKKQQDPKQFANYIKNTAYKIYAFLLLKWALIQTI